MNEFLREAVHVYMASCWGGKRFLSVEWAMVLFLSSDSL